MVCSKVFLSKFGSYKISLKTENWVILKFLIQGSVSVHCMGPLEHFANKPWSVVRSFCQSLAFIKFLLKRQKTMAFCQNWVILKFLIQGSVSVHWVLLNISPTNHGL